MLRFLDKSWCDRYGVFLVGRLYFACHVLRFFLVGVGVFFFFFVPFLAGGVMVYGA